MSREDSQGQGQDQVESERWRVRKDGSRFLANLVITAARRCFRNADWLLGDQSLEREDTQEVPWSCSKSSRPTPMVVVDQEGEIVLLNVHGEAVWLPSRRAARAEGHRDRSRRVCGAADRLAHAAPRMRSRLDGSAPGSSSRRVRKDGSAFPIEIMLSPLESKQGILVTAAIRDISVRKDTEHMLHRWRAGTGGCSKPLPTPWWWSIEVKIPSC